MIFGRGFDRVCGCTFRFDDPDAEDLNFMVKRAALKKKELREKQYMGERPERCQAQRQQEERGMRQGYPSKEEAEKILQEAESCNPGPWGAHSRCVAECAERIAAACGNMDVEKAYVLGLLHDIGRKFGARHLGHVYDGWKYMEWMGCPEAGRICLSHSFVCQSLELYIGKFDILPEQEKELREALEKLEYDDYDRLIQLCDAIGTAEGVATMEDRMQDIRRRYGNYPEEKWKRNLALREYFEERIGRELYSLLGEQEITRQGTRPKG